MAFPRPALALLLLLLPTAPAAAQSGLQVMFDDLFDELLVHRLQRVELGPHGDHYIPAADAAERVLVPALSTFIAANVTNFPTSSTQVGVTFDFSSGQPVARVNRLGPIFTETAGTLGRRHLAVGATATYLSLDRIRGDALDDVRFSFLHQDVDPVGTEGDPGYERDVLVIEPHLDLDAVVAGFHATYGVTDRLDVGLAVPVVSLDAEGTAVATVDTTTFPVHLHNYGGTLTDPVLTSSYDYAASEVTVPSIAIRAKYNFYAGGGALALLPEVEIPVASATSLIGEQHLVVGARLVGSRGFGRVNAQLNAGYDLRTGDGVADLLTLAAGFDTNLTPSLSLAGALLGRFSVAGDGILFYDADAPFGAPGSDSQYYVDADGAQVPVPFSNIADSNDPYAVGTLGARFAFSRQLQGLVSVLVPLSSGGLQSSVAPTVGLTYAPF